MTVKNYMSGKTTRTTRNNGHSHEILPGMHYTTLVNGHQHRVDRKTGEVLVADGHTHDIA